MLRTSLMLFLLLIGAFCPVRAQETARFESIDSLIASVYSVISGPAGERDWGLFQSLFHKDATMGAVVSHPGKPSVFKKFTPADYIRMNAPFFSKSAFYEKELGRKQEVFGNIAHVFSSYECIPGDGEKERGVNSIQLIREGGRWYVFSLIWQEETKEFSLEPHLRQNSRE